MKKNTKDVKRTHAVVETIILTIVLGMAIVGTSVAYNFIVQGW